MFLSAVRRTAPPSTSAKRLISVRVNLCYDLVNQPLDCINSSFPICLRSRYYMAHQKPRKLANTTFSNTLNWLEGGNIFMTLKVCRPSLWFFFFFDLQLVAQPTMSDLTNATSTRKLRELASCSV